MPTLHQPAEPVTPTVSEFEKLRAAVQSARQHHATLEAEHLKHQPARLDLDRQLAEARETKSTALQNIQALEARLQKAQEQHTVCRNEVRRLEELKRNLPDTDSLDRAKRALTEAEQAYQTLVQL